MTQPTPGSLEEVTGCCLFPTYLSSPALHCHVLAVPRPLTDGRAQLASPTLGGDAGWNSTDLGPRPDLLDEAALQGRPVFGGRANSSPGAHWHLDTSPADRHRSVSGTSTVLPSQLRLCWHLTLCGHMKESARLPPGSQATVTAQSVPTQSHT